MTVALLLAAAPDRLSAMAQPYRRPGDPMAGGGLKIGGMDGRLVAVGEVLCHPRVLFPEPPGDRQAGKPTRILTVTGVGRLLAEINRIVRWLRIDEKLGGGIE